MQSARGGGVAFRVPASVNRGLRDLSRREGVTLYMTLLAGFQTLLSRYSGERDIAVGSPVAGRTHRDLEGLIGCFVNTLVMRTDLRGQPTVRALLARVRETTLGAYAHQDLPFERLVDALQPTRDLSHHPLFQVTFTLQHAPREALGLPGLRVAPLELEPFAAPFDLALSMTDSGGDLTGVLGFNADLFDRQTIEAMTVHLQRLWDEMAARPDAIVDTLTLLSDREQQRLIAPAPAPAGSPRHDGPTCLYERFEHHAAVRPDAVAVVCDGGALTYHELNRRANQVAHALRRRGVGPEGIVGLHLDRSLELIVGLLGIQKAGGAYLPLDPAYPSERLRYMLEAAGARVSVTHESLADRLTAPDLDVLRLDGTFRHVARERDTNPECRLEAAHPSYVIFTSGSTGRPKGVAVTHGNAHRLLTSTAEWFHFSETDVWTLFHSCAFDFSVWELWGALAHGGRLVVVPFWASRTPDAFYDLLAREGVTVLNQTPSAFRQSEPRRAAARPNGRARAPRG